MRCGYDLDTASRTVFAAAPHERLLAPRLVSTVFPHLPRSSMRAFHAALLIGVALVVGLASARLFPVALVTAAFVVPVLMIVYALQVDVFEDEPAYTVALVAGFSLVAAGVTGALVAHLLPRGAALFSHSTTHELVWHGVVVPVLTTALALAAPLVLLRAPRFNDVLDGTTFGVTSAVACVAGEMLGESASFFTEGLRPVGRVWPWVVRLVEIGFAVPLVVGGSIGGACAALWLRYRAPLRDRAALGVIGHPVPALASAAAVVVGASLAQLLLGRLVSLVVLAALAVIAICWLRVAIHLGLMEEAREDAVGPSFTCANCRRSTPRHTFCTQCGISLLALPKAAPSS